MTNDTKYNGWTNYETWVVKLWIDNSEGDHIRWTERTQELVQEAVQDASDADADDIRSDAVSTLASELENDHDEAIPDVSGVFSDLLGHALGCVDWREIAEHYVNDIDLYSAGWNMPGCMPDSPPVVFADADDARMYVSEQMDRDAESFEDDIAEEDTYSAKTAELEKASLECLKGSGEYGATVAGMHYFVTKL